MHVPSFHGRSHAAKNKKRLNRDTEGQAKARVITLFVRFRYSQFSPFMTGLTVLLVRYGVLPSAGGISALNAAYAKQIVHCLIVKWVWEQINRKHLAVHHKLVSVPLVCFEQTKKARDFSRATDLYLFYIFINVSSSITSSRHISSIPFRRIQSLHRSWRTPLGRMCL